MPVVCAAVVGAKVKRGEQKQKQKEKVLASEIDRSRLTSTPSASSKKKQNNPLYLETFTPPAGTVSDAAGDAHDDDGDGGALRFHFAVHAALDAVEERVTRSSSSSASSSSAAAVAAQARARAGGVAPDSGEAYLGVLYPSDEFVVYG